MIVITKAALGLTKRYAAGASCKVNFENIEKTMFYPHYEKIAREQGFSEIRREIVKKYWFKIHNRIVIELFLKGKYNLRQADNCLVHSAVIKFIPPVTNIKGWDLEVDSRQLGYYKQRLFLSANLVPKKIKRGGLRKIEKGNWITVHGGVVVEVITKEEADFLERKTEEVIDSINQSSKK